MVYSNVGLNCHRSKHQGKNLSEVFGEGIHSWLC